MELIKVYETNTGWENLWTAVAILTLIAAIAVFAVTWVCEDRGNFKQRMIGISISAVLLAIFIACVTYNIKTDDITAYKYYVSDPQQLAQMLDNGWTIDTEEDGVYDLIRE